MADHAWCRDPSRDERVRAAEDGRDGPLPTLGECIAGVTDSMSGNARGEKMEQGNFAEPAERSVELSKTGDGQSGLRTERVALEVTHDASRDDPRLIDAVRRIAYAAVEREFRYPGESVRVVSDEEPGRDMGNGVFVASVSEVHAMYGETVNWLTAERDAAIRERDAAVAESERRLRLCETMKRDGDSARFHAAVAQARVAELEAASGGNSSANPNGSQAASGGGEGEPVAWGISNPGHPHFGNCEVWTVRTTEEIAKAVYSDAQGWQHFPLYRAPPQPRGWLTGDERRFVHWWAHEDRAPTDEELDAFKIAAKALLARSTPPEVVLDAFPTDETGELFSRRDVIKALAAAGVAVKEVGK
jgi:hypothetical protein